MFVSRHFHAVVAATLLRSFIVVNDDSILAVVVLFVITKCSPRSARVWAQSLANACEALTLRSAAIILLKLLPLLLLLLKHSSVHVCMYIHC